MLAGLLVLATMAGVSPNVSAPMRFKIDVKTVQEIDLTAMGQGKMPSDVTSSAWITVTMSDTSGGQLAHVVIDSMTLTPTGMAAQQLPPDAAAGAKGAVFHLYIVDGKIKGPMKPSIEGNMAVGMVQQGIALLFPGARAGMKAGDTWTDTTKVDTSTDASTQTGSTVTLWKVVSLDGDAYNLEGALTGTMNAEQGGGQVSISSKQAGTTTVTTSVKGPASKALVSTRMDATIVAAQVPDPISMVGTTIVSITALP